MDKLIKVWNVGHISYSKALYLQKLVANLHNKNIEVKNTLLCLEHPPVYTTGLRTKHYTDEEEAKLKATGKFIIKFGSFCTLGKAGDMFVFSRIVQTEFCQQFSPYTNLRLLKLFLPAQSVFLVLTLKCH